MDPNSLPWPFSLLFGSGADSLLATINQINDTEFPDVGSKDFQSFWQIDFGFAVIVAIIAAIVSLLQAAHKRDLVVILNGISTVIKVFIFGYLAPPTIYLLMWAAKRVTTIIALIPASVDQNDGDVWYSIYTGVTALYAPTAVIGYKLSVDAMSSLLAWEVSNIVGAIFFFMFLALAAYPLHQFGFWFTVYRIGIAGVVTTLVLMPIVILVLALGASAMRITGTTVSDPTSPLLLILIVASVLPLLIFHQIFRRSQKVQIEGPAFNAGGGSPWDVPVGNGISFGSLPSRPYAGRIPQAGDTMESVASKANWISQKASIAAAMIAPVDPAIAAGVKTTAMATGAIGGASQAVADQQKLSTVDSAEQPHDSNSAGANSNSPAMGRTMIDAENRTLNGATVKAIGEPDIDVELPAAASDTNPGGAKVDSAKRVLSKTADRVSETASAVEKSARWASGVQRNRMRNRY
jgi:hypothetical protein